jgi:c-di-GMP-binding flagellar brake protein YcgR
MADIGTAYDENFPYYNMFINRRTGFRVSLQDSWKIKMSRKYVWMKDRFTMSCRLHE